MIPRQIPGVGGSDRGSRVNDLNVPPTLSGCVRVRWPGRNASILLFRSEFVRVLLSNPLYAEAYPGHDASEVGGPPPRTVGGRSRTDEYARCHPEVIPGGFPPMMRVRWARRDSNSRDLVPNQAVYRANEPAHYTPMVLTLKVSLGGVGPYQKRVVIPLIPMF